MIDIKSWWWVKLDIWYIYTMLDLVNKGMSINTALEKIKEAFGKNPTFWEMIELLMYDYYKRNNNPELVMIANVLWYIWRNKEISHINWCDIIKKTYVPNPWTESDFAKALTIVNEKIKKKKQDPIIHQPQITHQTEKSNTKEVNIKWNDNQEWIKETNENSLDAKYILSERGLSFIEIDDVVLPPDDLEKESLQGSGKWGWSLRLWWADCDRLWKFLDLSKEKDFDITDIIIWTIKKFSMRNKTYVSMYVPVCNKTVLLCNQYGNASFVLNWKVTTWELTTFMKKSLKWKSEKIICKVDEIESRDEDIFNALIAHENIFHENISHSLASHMDTNLVDSNEYINNELTKEEILQMLQQS